MRNETVTADITVVGGGLAGVCAAIAAARLGRSVSLVNNRPVLGGNSSSEVRVWVCGATGHGAHRYAREGGIMGELFVENQFRNPLGNPYLWDLVVMDAVRSEPNISLFLNTDVREIDVTGPEDARHITSVTGWMMGSERLIRYESPIFLDCTGDALIGALAGARHRIGREAQSEYGETLAPEVADSVTLGSTMLFYTKDAGEPVRFVPPSFAKDITTTSIPERRIIRAGDNGCAYWWIEWGGEHDIVHDNERVRDELWSVIYGIWDYIKNSGKFDAETMTLEWVGALPGKREYRRLMGDHVLTQQDIVELREFPDPVAAGGWSIDLHPPEGMYASEAASKHIFSDGTYHVPFRSLYSVNVSNLLMAGRDISASHVAFGSTRVMATCAVLGEAAGTGAALCSHYGKTPREIATDHVADLLRTLSRQDASVFGLRNIDPDDLALSATASASGAVTSLLVDTADEAWPLAEDAAVVVPVDPRLESIAFLVDASSATSLDIELHRPSHKQNYVPNAFVAKASVPVSTGARQWAVAELPWTPDEPGNAFVIVRANPAVSLHVAHHPTPGVLSLTRGKPWEDHGIRQLIRDWSEKPLVRRTFCLRMTPATNACAADKAIDGYARPYGGPHMWVSEPLRDEAWLQLAWPSPVDIGQVEITFDDDVNEDLINLHHHRTPGEEIPTLVRDYRVEAWVGNAWRTLVSETGNRRRRRVHPLPTPVRTDRLRVVPTATNGARSAHVVAIRAYEQPS